MSSSAAKKQDGFRVSEGDLVDRYVVSTRLGKGSFGVVRLAVEKNGGRKWAVKTVDHENLTKKDLQELKEEVHIMGGLRHAHIVMLHEVFEDHGCTHLVMEVMLGGEMFDRIVEKEKYSEREACSALLSVASAVRYCHDHGVVHRDLKVRSFFLFSSNCVPLISAIF